MKRMMIPALAALGLATAVLAADIPQSVNSTPTSESSQGGAMPGSTGATAGAHKRKKVAHHKKSGASTQSGTMEKKPMEGTGTVK